MRRNVALVGALSLALALSSLAPALAEGPSVDRGNWLRSQAEPVELEPEDISFREIDGIEYVRVQHDIGEYERLVQREPARYQQNEVGGADSFEAAWLGIAEDGEPLGHKGQLNWYYEVDEGEWVSLTFQFNGKGELQRVNGVSP